MCEGRGGLFMAFVEGGSRSYGKEVIMKCTYVM